MEEEEEEEEERKGEGKEEEEEEAEEKESGTTAFRSSFDASQGSESLIVSALPSEPHLLSSICAGKDKCPSMPLVPQAAVCCRQSHFCSRICQQKEQKDALCQLPPSDLLGTYLSQVTQILSRTQMQEGGSGKEFYY